MRDSIKQQTIRACGGMKSAAEIMGFLSSIVRSKARSHPDDPADSPRLRIIASAQFLAAKTGYSRMQVLRALKLLCRREFIKAFKSQGETTEYQIDLQAISRWVQPMELFERDEDVTGTSHSMLPVPVTPCYRYQSHGVTGPPISTYSPINSITPGDGVSGKDSDQDRDQVIEQARGLGISKELTEAHLRRYPRQWLKAASAYVLSRRGVNQPAGLYIAFLKDPAGYGFEHNQSGELVSSVSLARRAKAINARDRPYDPKLAAVAAWDALGGSEQAEVRRRVEHDHPLASPAVRLSYCHQEALNRKTSYVQEEKQDDPGAVLRGNGSAACHAAGSR